MGFKRLLDVTHWTAIVLLRYKFLNTNVTSLTSYEIQYIIVKAKIRIQDSVQWYDQPLLAKTTLCVCVCWFITKKNANGNKKHFIKEC